MRFLLAFLLASSSVPASAAAGDLSRFLKTCAWGIAIGAGVGAVSLAFENKPSDHTINIARGASLGLYGGILYGLAQVNQPAAPPPETYTWLAPAARDGRLDGVAVHSLVLTF